MEERQRAIQAVRDITTGQPTPTHEENQMYDWDGQFDETLGLPIQLRNRVSDPGTPPVRVSPRAPAPGGGTIKTTANIESGPKLHPVTKDTRGNGTGEVEKLPSQQGEDRTVPPTPQPQPEKIQFVKGTVGQADPQEVHHRVNFTTDEEGPGRETYAGPGDTGTQEELLEPTPYGPPGQKTFDHSVYTLIPTPPSIQHPARYVEAQTIRQNTVHEVGGKNRKT